MTDTDRLTEALHQLHGHRLGVVRQQLVEGNETAALLKQGEARGVAAALRLLNNAETNDWDDWDDKPQYAAVSRAMLAADEQARNSEQTEGLRGLE
jgi:hypothetical protein